METVEEIVADHFRDRPDVVSVYLFGSHARRTARPESDVDVGLLYESPPESTLRAQPFADEAELGKKLGKRVQIVVMNKAPADLVHRIFSARRLLLDRDPSRRVAFEVKRRNEYFDLKPILDRYRRVGS